MEKEYSVKNKIFHTQDLCLRTNLRCAESCARMEIFMSAKDTMENKITEGVIWKQLLLFFFPILVGTFFQQLYNTVDAVIVGRFVGKEALSCVSGSSGQIINLVVGFFTGLSAGATVMISQHFGAKNEEQLRMVLKWMNTPENLLPDSTLYVRIYFAGLLFIFVYNMGAAILRAIGDSKRPLYFLIICCIVNIILDLVLVLGFKMGVLGVAVATLIAQGISAVLVSVALMYHTAGLKLIPREIRIHKSVLKNMLAIGLPTGIESSMYSISNVIVQAALNGFGVDTMAAWAAFGKIDSLFWMINSAFGIAATTFVGQNFGAGKMDRVRKGTRECLGMALVTAILLSVILMSAGRFLFGIFTTDANVVEIGLSMMQIISPTYFLFVFIEVYSGALRAQGHVIVTTAMTMIGICVLRVVWVTWIVPDGTLSQIVACYPITWLVSAVGMIIYYHYKQKKILEKFAATHDL